MKRAKGARSDHARLGYRPDIDGLRAVAVVAVIWFHSGLAGLPGGFTGVDVFFVISGYLITSLIHRDVQAGTFTFRHFYERRFRRIAPALVTVLAATMAAGYLLLLPYELEELGKSAATAVGMAANVYFWLTANYFAFAHGIVPLLHSWSLGVEEQFYLLFPAVLLGAERLRAAKTAVALLGIGSLLLCVALTPAMPAASFYLLPTRGWELMAGASLAVGLVAVPPAARQFAAMAGTGLVVAGLMLISADDPFPGWRALLPAIGTVLVIGGGPASAIARTLSLAPLVYVGRISYSLYLWHWPIFVFLRHWRADLDLPASWAVGGIAAAFLLSAASYRWVEQPARRRSTPFRMVIVPVVFAAAVVLAVSVAAVAGRGLPARLPAEVNAMASAHEGFAALAHRCSGIGFERAMDECRFGSGGAPKVLVWGDSHAAAISDAVADALGEPGVVVSMGACPPIPGWPDGEDPAACRAANEQVLRLAETDASIGTVVLSAYWQGYSVDERARFWGSIQQVVDRLKARGKTVAVVAGVPNPGVDVPWASAIRARFGRPPIQLRCPPARVPLKGAIVVDVSSGFCRDAPYRLYSDSNHPSRYAGLTIIAPALKAALPPR